MAYFSNNRTGSILGADVSENQGTTNFATMFSTGTRFLYIRTITSNPARLDNNAVVNATNARSAGLKCGGYHLLRPDLMGLTSAVAEADRFASALLTIFGADANNPYGDLIPMVDLELPYPRTTLTGAYTVVITPDQYLDYAETYINRLLSVTGFNKVVIYTGEYFTADYNNFYHTTKGFLLNKYPLALTAKDPSLYVTGANVLPSPHAETPYPNDNFLTMGGWSDWLIWQYVIDYPDVRVGVAHGTTSVDLDLEALKPGFTITDLYNSTYAVATAVTIQPPAYIGGVRKVNTNLTNLSINGDFYVQGTDKEVVASPMLAFHKEAVLADLLTGFTVIEALPGKNAIVEKIQVCIDTQVETVATAQIRFQTIEATPRAILTTTTPNLGSGAKINSDGFSYFTEGTGMMRKKLGVGIGVQCVPLQVFTAGALTITVYYRYV